MSPTTRTTEWLNTHSLEKKGSISNVLGVKGSKITKHQVATPGKSAKSQGKFWDRLLPGILNQSPNKEIMDDFEGSTLVGDNADIKTEHSVDDNRSSHTDLDGNTIVEPTPYWRNLSKIPPISDGPITDLNDERMKEWSNDEVWLFEKLNMRGFEPLMEATWHMDFVTLPIKLFSHDPRDAFINAASGRDYRARKALNTLLSIGADARDRLVRSLTPEPAIHRDLSAYQKWTLQDAHLLRTPYIPLLAIASAVPKESVASVVSRLTDQLHDMGRRYRDLYRVDSKTANGKHSYKHKLPTLYGIMVKYSVVAFMTWDSSQEGKPLRNIGVFDLKKGGQDVWHAIAIAILVVKARNDLMALRQQGWIGEEDEDSGIDPDA